MNDVRGRWAQLLLLAAAELLGMSVWFAGSAVAPALRVSLGLSTGQVGWLTSGVQLGFVGGTLLAAATNLPDLVPARRYFAASALLAALANGSLHLARGFPVALASRLLTGCALAGVYPPAMKMAATWFRSGRGLAIAVVVGALTVGKAFPYLLEGAGNLPLATTILLPSAAAVVAAILVATGYRDGPHAFPARPFSWGLVGAVLRVPAYRDATGGYLGHMWELYAYWAWLPGYLAASFAARGIPTARVGVLAFCCVAVGIVGCLWGGWAADRIGRVPVVRMALRASGVCALLSAVVFGGPPTLVVGTCLVWGVAVIADSAQFSALVTEVSPAHAVGTALTLQTAFGFLLTIGSIQLVPVVAGHFGWRFGYVILALGPVAALAAMRSFQSAIRA